jgi:hypothetical protein
MRRVYLASVVLTALSATNVQAESTKIRPWCLVLTTRGGGTECLYQTLAQCRLSAAGGIMGHCIENPAIAWKALREGKPLPPPSPEWRQ